MVKPDKRPWPPRSNAPLLGESAGRADNTAMLAKMFERTERIETDA